jgi:hypothetical protein
LAQPAIITLPEGEPIPIVPGNPVTRPQGVTLDSEGSAYPGQPGVAAPGLFGAATPGGPFSGLDHAAVGDEFTLEQHLTGNGGAFDCVQHWRIVRISPTDEPWTGPTDLRLIGFAPQGAAGPDLQFWVDAHPA